MKKGCNGCGGSQSCSGKNGCHQCGSQDACQCNARCESCEQCSCCPVTINRKINRHILTLREMAHQGESAGCKYALHLFEQLSCWICQACSPTVEDVRAQAHKIIEKMRNEKTYEHIPEKLKCLFHEIVFCKSDKR